MINFENYVGTRIILKEDISSDKRGVKLRKGMTLKVRRIVNTQHLCLEYLDGKLAASQVHFSKLMTG